MSRAHKEKARIVSIQSNQVLCESRNDTAPILEPTICQPPAYGIVQEEPTVDTGYREGFVLDTWSQPRKPFNTVSFNNLEHVFGSWDLSDIAGSGSGMISAGKPPSQQSDSSIFRIDRGQRQSFFSHIYSTEIYSQRMLSRLYQTSKTVHEDSPMPEM